MKRNPSDALLIAREHRYNVDDPVTYAESPPVYTGPPPVFLPPHSKFGALGSVTASDNRSCASVEGGRAGADTFDGGLKKVFSFTGYVGTPHVATPHDVLASGGSANVGAEHHAQHLENGVDAILPAHYNECTKALTSGSHAILDRASLDVGGSGSSGPSSGIGTATPSPSPSPPPPSRTMAPRLSAETRTASQSHGSLLELASSLFHRPQHGLHEQQPAAHADPVARLGLEHNSSNRLKSRGSEPNFMSSRYVGSTHVGKTSPLSLRYKQPLVSGQDLNAMAPLDL